MTWSDPSGLFWGNLWSGIQSAAEKIGNAVSSAWNATVSFVDKYKAEIAGVVVGLAVGIGCTVATAGAGVVACAIAGGAAGAAVTNVIKQAESGKPFDVGSFLFDTAVGGALGAVGGAAGPLLSSAIRSITTSGAGAAAVNAVRTGLQNTLNQMPSFRPAPAPVRPPVAPGGGAARPPGSPSNNAASCAIGNSFAPATLVLMADGSTEPIEQIELGDEVWAADPETSEAGARPVTALIEGEGVKDLVTVSTASGSVVATAGHPFWSVSDAAWVDAGDLSVGDAVLQAGGARSVVTAVSEVSRQATVHNLTVAGLHPYFVVVGDAPTLVHNCGGTDDFVDLYRHVSPDEAADIAQHGFRERPNSLSGKWFAETFDAAMEWGARLNQGVGSVVHVRVPNGLAGQLARTERLDGIGPARFVEPEQLGWLNNLERTIG